LDDLKREWPRANFSEVPERTGEIAQHLFLSADEIRQRQYQLFLKGTNFQVKVWEALLAVRSGMLTSYADLAKLVGMPRSVRAVAGAVAHNPIAYLIPCHRVIQNSGAFHHYRWGAARKTAMIGWEAVRASQME
jgi:AraC family transcriptional regulator of adaptative response/methylated-DNA-[protein]-cysteine methyltransferase